MHFVRFIAALGTFALVSAGCTCGVLDPATRFACSSTAECGPGYLCLNGECVSEAFVTDAGGGRDGGSDAGADAGSNDAGVDADQDGYPVGVDCDDTNRFVNPGAAENCSNVIDDDCDSRSDCQAPSCNGLPCASGAICMNMVCIAPTEVRCDDGLDNDGDLRIDCLDPDCPVGARCEDGNMCSTASVCASDGGCAPTATLMCMSPPSVCFAPLGACSFDAGACAYTPTAGACEDGLLCTTNDVCNGASGACLSGQRVNCPNSGNQCLQNNGVCVEDAGCVYTPRTTTTSCNDGNACTTIDRCDGDGGCVGQSLTCVPPSQCFSVLGCAVDAGCQFTVRAGAACDGGVCSTAGVCTSSSVFGYAPSNFTEAQLPVASPNALNINCSATLDTSSGMPTFNAPCISTQPTMVIIPSGSLSTPEYLLVETGPFTLSVGSTLTITGSRPVIFAVIGSATISGRLRARNPMTSSLCSTVMGTGLTGQDQGNGSSGAGHATPGGNGGSGNGTGLLGGGAFGVPSVIPLLSGCPGGGDNNTAGEGGGAVQFSARDDVVVGGTIGAVGEGGLGNQILEVPGGGGSGGSILLEGRNVMLVSGSWLSTNGGGGAEGTSFLGLGGNDGEDGSETSTVPALGGAGASMSAGNGGNGGSGFAVPQPGFPASSGSSSGHGSGGGATGRIRLNATTSCQTSGGISPPASGNGALGCPSP